MPIAHKRFIQTITAADIAGAIKELELGTFRDSNVTLTNILMKVKTELDDKNFLKLWFGFERTIPGNREGQCHLLPSGGRFTKVVVATAFNQGFTKGFGVADTRKALLYNTANRLDGLDRFLDLPNPTVGEITLVLTLIDEDSGNATAAYVPAF